MKIQSFVLFLLLCGFASRAQYAPVLPKQVGGATGLHYKIKSNTEGKGAWVLDKSYTGIADAGASQVAFTRDDGTRDTLSFEGITAVDMEAYIGMVGINDTSLAFLRRDGRRDTLVLRFGSGGGTSSPVYQFSSEFLNQSGNISIASIAASKISGLNTNNWNTAYSDRVTGVGVAGVTSKTITLTQGDGGTVTGTFNDPQIINQKDSAQTASFRIRGTGHIERLSSGNVDYKGGGFTSGQTYTGSFNGPANIVPDQHGTHLFHTMSLAPGSYNIVSDADFPTVAALVRTNISLNENRDSLQINYIDRASFSSGGGLNGILNRFDFWPGSGAGDNNTRLKKFLGVINMYSAAIDMNGAAGSQYGNIRYYHAGGYRTYGNAMAGIVGGSMTGFYVSALHPGAANRWGFYQESANDKNYFGGDVYLNKLKPTSGVSNLTIDATGKIGTTTATGSTGGDGNYIQNQTAIDQSASMRILGTAQASRSAFGTSIDNNFRVNMLDTTNGGGYKISIVRKDPGVNVDGLWLNYTMKGSGDLGAGFSTRNAYLAEMKMENTGNVTGMFRVYGSDVYHLIPSGASWQSMAGFYSSMYEHNGTPQGTLTNMYHFYARNNKDATVTNMYGLYVAPMKRTGVTNAWGVYQESANDNNYFAGDLYLNKLKPASGVLALTVDQSGKIGTTALGSGTGGTTYSFSSEFTNSDNFISVNQIAPSKITGLHAVATTGSYNSLTNLPTLFTVAGTKSEGLIPKVVGGVVTWAADASGSGEAPAYTFSSEFTNNANAISVNSIASSKITGLHTIATTGDYNNLVNRPSLFTVAGAATNGYLIKSVNGVATWSADKTFSSEFINANNSVSIASIASTKITGLHSVAITGDYNQLINKPTSSGEANTTSNLGTGVGLAAAKSGVNLPFKSLIAGSGITITQDASHVTIGTTNAANWNAAANDRVTAASFTGTATKTMTLTQADGGTLSASFTDLGENNTASNLGTGFGVYASKAGANLFFKTLRAGTNVTMTSDANSIYINASGGTSTTASGQNLGTGQGIFSAVSGSTLQFKSLTASSGLSVSSTSTTVNVSAPNAGSWDAAAADRITSVAVSGNSTKTMTLYQADGGQLSANFDIGEVSLPYQRTTLSADVALQSFVNHEVLMLTLSPGTWKVTGQVTVQTPGSSGWAGQVQLYGNSTTFATSNQNYPSGASSGYVTVNVDHIIDVPFTMNVYIKCISSGGTAVSGAGSVMNAIRVGPAIGHN